MSSSPMPMVQHHSAETLPEQAMRYLGLHPDNPTTWVLAALARKYELDPLLNQIAIITTKQGAKPYITRDGLLSIAHRSGVFDGLTVDELREGDTGWACTVTVWRKDMSHGFTYSAGCGKREQQALQGHGPEMALARAERRALHRAFDVPMAGAEWEDDDAPLIATAAGEVAARSLPQPSHDDAVPRPTDDQTSAIRALWADLGLDGTDMRPARLEVTSAAVGRLVTDTRELTRDDADRLLLHLHALRAEWSLQDDVPATGDEDEGDDDG